MSEQPDSVEQTPEAQESAEVSTKVEFSEEQQKVIDSQIAGKAFEVREERRKSVALQKQLDEATAKIPKETRPDVVGNGDIYDENYESNRAARESQLVQQARFDARQEFEVDQQNASQLAKQQAEQTARNESLNEYTKRAASMGITPQELQQAGETVFQYGLRQDVIEHLITDNQGPFMTRYFEANLHEIDVVNSLGGIAAGEFIKGIREKATALYTKRTSNAPDPADNLSGSGVVPKVRGVGGTTYD